MSHSHSFSRMSWFSVIVFSIGAVLRPSAHLGAEDARWPRWRGPLGDGHAGSAQAPTRWDASMVKWKTELPGSGQSSPTIWGDRIFLTTALDEGRQRVVLCVDGETGRIVWRQVAWTGDPEPIHRMNSWASATCATNGDVVVAFFGKGGLHAYTVDGEHLWSRDLGPFEGPWGTAACPVIVGDLVIQNGDSDKDAFIEAFELMTGKTVWKRPRPDHRGWSTPILVRRGEQTQLVLNGHTGVTAYDPATGETLWFTPNTNGRGEPTVTPAGDLLYVVCGLSGNMYAVRPGDALREPQIQWTALRKGGRDLPSPIVVSDYVLVTSMNGIATCYDARSGKEYWKQRLEGQFSSSPVAVGSIVLQQNEAGDTYAIELGAEFKVIAKSRLDAGPDEIFRASLMPVGSRIYARSTRALYCIESPKASATGG